MFPPSPKLLALEREQGTTAARRREDAGLPCSAGRGASAFSHVLSVHFPLTFLPHHYSGGQRTALAVSKKKKKPQNNNLRDVKLQELQVSDKALRQAAEESVNR